MDTASTMDGAARFRVVCLCGSGGAGHIYADILRLR
jgi:hypothetical protein